MITKSVFSGFGGQGVLLMGYVAALAAMRDDKHVTFLPAYGAEIRGGTANSTVVISDEEIASPVASSPDVIVVMNNPSLLRFASIVKPGGAVLVNSSLVGDDVKRDDVRVLKIPASSLALEMEASRSANMIMLGALSESMGILSLDSLKCALKETGLGKKKKLLETNEKALEIGRKAVRKL